VLEEAACAPPPSSDLVKVDAVIFGLRVGFGFGNFSVLLQQTHFRKLIHVNDVRFRRFEIP
jgi:hypothetical protein